MTILSALVLLPLCAQGQKKWAVVNASSCFLRAEPDYESSNETQCLMGTVLEVTASDRYWRKVNAPFYKDCWTNDLVLAYMDDAEKKAYEQALKWICTAEHSHLYDGPGEEAAVAGDLELGNIIRRLGSVPQNGRVGALTAAGKEVWIPETDVSRLEEWQADRQPSHENVVNTARKFLGTPYMWGGNCVNYFDCSGLVWFCYMLNGITLPRNAREQIMCGEEVPYDLGLMRPGDLVFYGRKATEGRPQAVTHVAMYIGDGHIIHSSMLVRISSLRPGDADYYEKEALGVRRILGTQQIIRKK